MVTWSTWKRLQDTAEISHQRLRYCTCEKDVREWDVSTTVSNTRDSIPSPRRLKLAGNRLVWNQPHFSHIAFSNKCGSQINADQLSSRSIILGETVHWHLHPSQGKMHTVPGPSLVTVLNSDVNVFCCTRNSKSVFHPLSDHNMVHFYIVYVYIQHQTLISKEQEKSRWPF